MSKISRFWDQSFFIPNPPLTEQNLPDQTGRVVIITGGYAGVGYELTRILYQCNATVYAAGRSPNKAESAINKIKATNPTSKGHLEFLEVDLSDLSSVKSSAKKFLAKEKRLDVLVNNAGVMSVPLGSTSAQGHELHFATNCLGPFLLTKLLTPLLQKTSASSPPGAVRITWAGSAGIDVGSPHDGGMEMDSTGKPIPSTKNPQHTYAATKTGNLFLASQYACHYPLDNATGKGIISNAFNPGNLQTELGRELPRILYYIISWTLTFPAKYGAYTELYAGWSEEMGRTERNGGYVKPWGRVSDVRVEVQREVDAGVKGQTESKAVKFWEWCERESREYS